MGYGFWHEHIIFQSERRILHASNNYCKRKQLHLETLPCDGHCLQGKTCTAANLEIAVVQFPPMAMGNKTQPCPEGKHPANSTGGVIQQCRENTAA